MHAVCDRLCLTLPVEDGSRFAVIWDAEDEEGSEVERVPRVDREDRDAAEWSGDDDVVVSPPESPKSMVDLYHNGHVMAVREPVSY